VKNSDERYLYCKMNVVIAGGGVAGLSAAAVLRKLPFIKSIKIFEPAILSQISRPTATNPKDINDVTNKSSPFSGTEHHYSGLWSPALQCLQSLGIYSKIENQLHAVRKSGYKNVAGRWLASPTVGLQKPPSKY
jgi:2-polyprenyl-6-methoxyphenol hydroxylase-like FAD-dependent oxidoreductase